MFISVDLPAPFSPRRQWISPGSIVRSILSFAVNDPNRLVSPRISRCIALLVQATTLGLEGHEEVRTCRSGRDSPPRPVEFGTAGRRSADLDLSIDDLLLEVLDLGIELAVDVGLRTVRRQ